MSGRVESSDVILKPGDHVSVDGSFEGGIIKSYRGVVVSVKPSGTVVVDDDAERDGLGTPVRHYVWKGTVTRRYPDEGRVVLVHLHVALPPGDHRPANAIAGAIMDAIEVGNDEDRFAGVSVELALVDEVS